MMQPTKETADSDSTTCGLMCIVSASLSSWVNHWRLCCWNDVLTQLWWPVSHQLTRLLGTLYQSPWQPLTSCSSSNTSSDYFTAWHQGRFQQF